MGTTSNALVTIVVTVTTIVIYREVAPSPSGPAITAPAPARTVEPLVRRYPRSPDRNDAFFADSNRDALESACGFAACDAFRRNECLRIVVGDAPTDGDLAASRSYVGAISRCGLEDCDQRADCVRGD